MMQKLADALLKYGMGLLIIALIGLTVGGVASFMGSDVTAPVTFLWSALFLMSSILMLIVGFCLDAQLEEWTFEQRRKTSTPKIALEPREKPEGYNRAVLGWFHEGPELRVRDDEFLRGFAARAAVPPRKKP